MKNRKSPAPLREQIVAFLKGREEATLKQIAAATSERDFPSRVTTELNKMRTDTLIECAKKKGKNELWYWLATAQADQSGNTQPAVVENTGSSASALPSTPVEGAAVQPKPAPVAAARLAVPVAEDENFSLMGVVADIRVAIGDSHGKIMLGDLADTVRARIQQGAEAERKRLETTASLTAAMRMLDEVRILLADVIECGDADRDSLNAVEMARAARTELLDAPPTVTPFDSNAQLSAEAEDRVTATLEIRPANRFLVRANGRPLVVRHSEVSAQRRAMQYARSGVRATVFAMERIGEARPGAEWGPAQ